MRALHLGERPVVLLLEELPVQAPHGVREVLQDQADLHPEELRLRLPGQSGAGPAAVDRAVGAPTAPAADVVGARLAGENGARLDLDVPVHLRDLLAVAAVAPGL